MTLDFRVLGPLEVRDGQRRVPIRGRLHPKVLAGLLLHNGRVVTLDWLVDLLWDDEPPATARRQVQNTVAALRRQLGTSHGGLIQRVGHGYRIDVHGDAVDVRRFEAGTRNGRRLVDGDQLAQALVAFDDALDHWRGPALEGIGGRILGAAKARLDDARLSAIEERAEVAILLGHAEKVITELRGLVEANPMRQRLTARLMTALDQQGERSEALWHFERLRDGLAQRLGIDPSLELAALQARIRTGGGTRREPHAPAAAAPVKSSSVVPAQLPADIATFTGRDEQITALDRLLASGSRVGVVSALTGIGGVGKTALAVHWGHAKREAFPDGQLYVNLRGFGDHEPLSPFEAVVRFLRVLDGSTAKVPATLDEATARYRSIISERRMLILLDNARSATQVRPLLPGGSGCLVLVTSRNRLSSLVALDDVQPIPLDALSPVESMNLLVNLIGPDTLRDETSTRRIAESCAHLPLALRIAAARLTQGPHTTIARLAEDLSTASRLRTLRLGDDPQANVTAVFEHSHAALEPDAKTVIRYLALIPGSDFTRDLAGAVSQIPEPRLDQVLESLVQAHLLEQRPADRYGFHDLIRLYVKKLADAELASVEQGDSINRMIKWYDANKSDTRLPEFDNLIAAFEAYSDHPQATKLALALHTFSFHGRDVNVIRKHLNSALRISESINDTESQIRLLGALGSTYSTEGDASFAITLYQQARAMLRHTNDLTVIGITLGNLGSVYYDASMYEKAEECILQAIDYAEQTGNDAHHRTRTANLGRVYRAVGRFAEAEEILTCSVKRAEDRLDTASANQSRISLSKLHVDMGLYQMATSEAHLARNISMQLKTPRIETRSLLILGEIACLTGAAATALDHLYQAAHLARRDGRFIDVLEAHSLMAEAHVVTHENEKALWHLRLAWDLHEQAPRTAIEAELCRSSCIVHAAAGRLGQAVDFGKRAVARFRQLKGPLRLGRSLTYLGDARAALGDTTTARTHWTEAFDIFRRLGVPEAADIEGKLRTRVR